MELTPLCGVEGGFTPKSVLKLGVLFAKHHNILLRLSAFIIRGVRYQFDTSPPPLLSPDYDGNYTPSNRRDWWVTLVAAVYNVMYILLSLSAFIMRG